ncbi:MAG: hypothetical protein KC766_21225 [Myxococcales bacterium]|nr:hypothetical protein [Myxococcales bacterium]
MNGSSSKRSWVPLSAGLVAATLLLVLGAASQRVSHAAETRLGALPPLQQNQRCEECHAEIAREWRASGHQLAFERPEFQHALLREPPGTRAFCSDCHAPESVRERERRGLAEAPVSQAAAELGVACTSCHTEKTTGEDARRLAASVGRSAPHAFMGTDGDAACGACHDFSFQGKRASFAMQRTLGEHRAGVKHGAAQEGETCVSCHMRRAPGSKHWSHAFPGGRDARFVASALKVSASRPEPQTLRVVLEPRDVSHAVPTGDLFRRLNVSVELAEGVKQQRYLARHFEDAPEGRREVRDDRVHLTPSVVEFALPGSAASQRVRWRVTYERVAHVDPKREDEATLDGWSLVASGEL